MTVRVDVAKLVRQRVADHPSALGMMLSGLLPTGGYSTPFGKHEVQHWMWQWAMKLTDEERNQLSAMLVRTADMQCD